MNKLKKILIAAFVAVSASAMADNDRIITFEQLPKAAQEFLNQHFAGVKISYAVQDDDRDYEVYLENGIAVDFYPDGEWDSVDGHRQAIPTTFINPKIVDYVKTKYPGTQIVEIDRNRRKFEVQLSNGLELDFGRDGTFWRVDYDD
ncbi:MAG: PepSY-like domain-containing protein [Prevotellaceae bacterium]|jgi:hypothetical protein|nr:PepSY-like domain-containing protein [Prevotellaceae bacterium]